MASRQDRGARVPEPPRRRTSLSASGSPATSILALQQAAGNRATSKLVADGAGARLTAAPHHGLVQRFQGSPVQTLEALVKAAVDELYTGITVQQAAKLVYRLATRYQKARPQHESRALEWEMDQAWGDIPKILKGQGVDAYVQDGFVRIENESAQERGAKTEDRRMSVNASPDHLIGMMTALHSHFGGLLSQVTQVKCPTRLAEIQQRMDNVVIYYYETAGQTTQRDNLRTLLSRAQDMVRPDHPAMLQELQGTGPDPAEGEPLTGGDWAGLARGAQRGAGAGGPIPGVGEGAGHDSHAWPRAEAIGTALATWRKTGKGDPLDLVKKALYKAGYRDIGTKPKWSLF